MQYRLKEFLPVHRFLPVLALAVVMALVLPACDLLGGGGSGGGGTTVLGLAVDQSGAPLADVQITSSGNTATLIGAKLG